MTSLIIYIKGFPWFAGTLTSGGDVNASFAPCQVDHGSRYIHAPTSICWPIPGFCRRCERRRLYAAGGPGHSGPRAMRR